MSSLLDSLGVPASEGAKTIASSLREATEGWTTQAGAALPVQDLAKNLTDFLAKAPAEMSKGLGI